MVLYYANGVIMVDFVALLSGATNSAGWQSSACPIVATNSWLPVSKMRLAKSRWAGCSRLEPVPYWFTGFGSGRIGIKFVSDVMLCSPVICILGILPLTATFTELSL